MITKNNVIIALSGVVLVGLLIGSIIVLKYKIDALSVQNDKLIEDLSRSNTEINNIKELVNKNIETIKDFNDKSLDIQDKYNKIEQKINKHDYENIAKKKPKKLAEVLTNSYNNNVDYIQEITTRKDKK